MKAIYTGIVVMLMLVGSSSYSQDKRVQDQLTGTWEINYELTIENLDKASKSHIESLDESRKERVTKAYKGRKVSFNADGTYLRKLVDGRSVKGSWQLIDDDTKVEITGPNGESKLLQTIVSLNDKTMVLRPEMEDNKQLTIPVWYFSKI